MKYKLPLFLIFSILLLVNSAITYSQGRYGIMLRNDAITCISSKSGNLYGGIDNYIVISKEITHKYGRVRLESTNGEIVHDSLNQYLAIPTRPGKVRYTIYASQSDSTPIGYRFFTVNRVPDPQLKIDGVIIPVRGQIDKGFLLQCDSLTVHISDDIPGSNEWIKVKEFELGYNYGGFHVTYLNPSNRMLMGTKEVLNTLGPDREISIKATTYSEGDVEMQLPIHRLMIY